MSPRPTKIIGVHLNYRSRAEQRGRFPAIPSYFLKPPSSLSDDGVPLVRPKGVELLVIEGEIALVIGKTSRNLTPERAVQSIGWIAPANDAGLHDLRWADLGSNVLSKGSDGFTPLGERVPAGDVDLEQLTLRTRLDGVTIQEGTSSGLVFGFGYLIADLSRFMTLEPGDIILSGTPAGARPVDPGSTVEVEIEGVGRVTNAIVESEEPLPAFGAQPRLSHATRAAAIGSNGARTTKLSDTATAALKTVSTATLTVQLAKRGIRNAFISGLRPTRPELRLLGYAYTLRYVPLREDVRDADGAELNAQKRAVETIGPDEVLVMDARQDAGAGTIGDILAARAMARGATGIVTDGGLRDSAAIAALGIPTYYQAPHAAVLGLIHYPLETNVPIACGGALVMPGDVLVGDADGVVVLPAALAEDIALDAQSQEEREAFALERVQDGESIREIYPLGPSRLGDYELWLKARNGAQPSATAPEPAAGGD